MLAAGRRHPAARWAASLALLLAACSPGDDGGSEREDSSAEATTTTAAEATTTTAAEATTTTVPSPSLTEQPPLTPTEKTIIDALGFAGVEEPLRGELPALESASVWARHDEGSEVFVNASPSHPDSGEIVDNRPIGGVTVLTREFESGRAVDEFDCDGMNYRLSGEPPPEAADWDMFLAHFIEGLGSCS